MTAGEEFVFSYPFVRGTFSRMDEDGVSKSPTWKPGTRFENVGDGDTATYADGLGFQKVTIVAIFRPGKFPERVFFTRKWTDPDGKVFGKGKLHIKTSISFRVLVAGYRHEFELSA